MWPQSPDNLLVFSKILTREFLCVVLKMFALKIAFLSVGFIVNTIKHLTLYLEVETVKSKRYHIVIKSDMWIKNTLLGCFTSNMAVHDESGINLVTVSTQQN